jgi:hypothetical protein
LPKALVREAQEVAHAAGTTIRARLQGGLRTVLARRRPAARFELPDASVGGNGVRPEFRSAGWDELRAATYGYRT